MLMLPDIAWFVLVLGLGVGYFTVSAIIHELGHWIAARLLGVTSTVTWSRSGPAITLTTQFQGPHAMTPHQDLVVTPAGVALQGSITLALLAQSSHPVLSGV